MKSILADCMITVGLLMMIGSACLHFAFKHDGVTACAYLGKPPSETLAYAIPESALRIKR